MNKLIRHSFISLITISLTVSTSVLFNQTSAKAGWLSDQINSVKNEVNHCIHGGCDPTTHTPREMLETATGVRAVGAATDRWLGRRLRIVDSKANQLKQRLRNQISENSQCMELPEMEGVCSEFNSLYGLNMKIKRISWETLADQYGSENLNYLRNCVSKPGLPFDSPKTWSCVGLSNYTE